MVEDKAADTFLKQIRDNTYWANEHLRDRHIEMIALLRSIKALLIFNAMILLGLFVAALTWRN
jgi:hypothetical protein